MSADNAAVLTRPYVTLSSIYVTDNTPQNGATVDCINFNQACAFVMFGNVTASASETITVKLQAGDQSNGSDAADISGATTTAITVSNAIDNTCQAAIRIDLAKLGKRYIRAVSTLSAVTTLMNCFVVIALSARDISVNSADFPQYVDGN